MPAAPRAPAGPPPVPFTVDDAVALLGRRHALPIARFTPSGAYLTLPQGGRVLLPGTELSEARAAGRFTTEPAVGDVVDVFLALDSEGRPVASLRTTAIVRGEVAFLEVTDETPFGVFVAWGLGKELLLPRGELVGDVRVGDRVPVALYVDDQGRLAGTMKVSELLRGAPPYARGAWVAGVAWRRDPDRGVFVILEGRYVGLLPSTEPHKLRRGESARFRIAQVHPDGKVTLSLRRLAHEERGDDGAQILAYLAAGGAPIGDRSPPEDIYALFRMSKKAFKRASGQLLKAGSIDILADGTLALRAAPEPR